MFRIGLSSCSKVIDEKLFANYQNAGIAAMEVCTASELYDSLDYRAMGTWAERYNVELWSFHLPFTPSEKVDISDPEVAEGAVAILGEYIRKAGDAGIKNIVIHASGTEPLEEDREERLQVSKHSLWQLAQVASAWGTVLAVEDLPRTCLGNSADEVLDLISVHPDLRVCFDTNHLLTEDAAEFVYKLGRKIVTTHVSDFDNINERHWLPGEGVLDWQRILKALEETGYEGPWLYELGFQCPKTIFRDRDLNCEDIARNARELFAGRAPTVFSRPKPGIGMWG